MVALVAVVASVTACAQAPRDAGDVSDGRRPAVRSATVAPEPGTSLRARERGPLRGAVLVVDPGHQLGNATHPDEVNRLVNAGGFKKACNTTGTATNGGYPEATFAWRVSKALARQLRRKGATVYLTRHSNSYDDWGPCINRRGRKGNRVHADAVVSVHGDGAASSARGFFVIRPANRKDWTDDIVRPSKRLARRVKRGLAAAGAKVSNTYGGDGFDVRGDLGTLNWSDVPIVMVELGNMRNRRDARRMRSSGYRKSVYARGLRFGITSFVRHR
jgi:N-acetylmuramoyl-L-alanine amidase